MSYQVQASPGTVWSVSWSEPSEAEMEETFLLVGEAESVLLAGGGVQGWGSLTHRNKESRI